MKAFAFYYAQLTEQQKKVYMTIYESWKNKKKEVSFEIPIGWDKANILWRIRCDHPLLFYIDQISYRTIGNKMTLYTKFAYTDNEIDYYTSKIKQKIQMLYDKFVRDKQTEYDKELAIHDCLCRNVKYDYDEVKINKYDKKNHNVLGTLLGQCGVCEGFAKVFKLMCDLAKIKCIVVLGEAYSGKDDIEGECGHAWNIVYIDNIPYQVDVTWDINLGHADDYFNLPDKSMYRDHKVDDDLPVTECKNLAYNYFYKNKLYANTPQAFSQLYKEKIKTGEKEFSIKANFDFNKEDLHNMTNLLELQVLIKGLSISYSVNETHKVVHFYMS